ncbi:MAG: alanine dehydrogenase [Actinomycetota bacterium]|nr:alanine dehydrogenase [Actinomycetota bacterium]
MRIGVPAEVKESEYRVAITPAGVRELTVAGHEVAVQAGAGTGSSLTDDDYTRAGARIVDDATRVWADAELLLKVKEPVEEEFEHLRPDLVLFTYLHLAAERPLTDALVKSGITAIAYETVEQADGALPLLAPMSEIAGRMAPQVGAKELEAPRGGRGTLMGGVSGVLPAHVVVIGAGVSGRNAAWIAAGMEARVTILDLDVDKLRYVDAIHQGKIVTLVSNRLTLEEQVAEADMVIGAVLVPGARAPRLLTEDMVASMRRGAVFVDISIDQGGCSETSRVTTHREPTYLVDGVVHYCVGNMPGAVPRTSTFALTNVTVPYVSRIAEHGVAGAARDPALARGFNVVDGAITNAGVAEAHDLAHTDLSDVLPASGSHD